MLNVTVKLTGSNLNAIQDALNNAAQLIGDGERHGEIGGEASLMASSLLKAMSRSMTIRSMKLFRMH